MDKTTDLILKLIPIGYPILIFLGFYNLHIYYGSFNIEILQYLTFTELLFSFIANSTPILIILFLIFSNLVFMAMSPSTGKFDAAVFKNYENLRHLSPVHKRLININKIKKVTISLDLKYSEKKIKTCRTLFLRKIEQRIWDRAIYHLLRLIKAIIIYIIKIISWIYFVAISFAIVQLLINPFELNISYFSPLFNSKGRTILILSIWFIIAFEIVYRGTRKFNNMYKILFRNIPLIIIILLSFTIIQKNKAENRINTPIENVKFQYQNEIIQSGPELIYLGKTTNYIFLKNIKENTNYVFQIDKVDYLEFKHL